MKCRLELTYDSEDRSTVPEDYSLVITNDQKECNEYIDMVRNQLKDSNVLHIGVGTSSVYWMLLDSTAIVDGLTVAESEVNEGERLKEIVHKPYCIFTFNKYDKTNWKNWPTKYSLICDNNLKQHACCQEHWEDYWKSLLDILDEGGVIVTHEQGFGSHKNKTTPLSLDELKLLSSGYEINVINSIGTTWHPVVIRKLK